MQAINTMISSRLKVIGNRTCESCGNSVPIIETIKNGEVVQVSECLNCETLKLQERLIQFRNEQDKRKNELIFEKYSLIPDELKTATFENYIPVNPSTVEAKKIAESYAINFDNLTGKNSILFQGPYGVGKSHLSYAIANYLKSKGKIVIFMSMPDLLNLLRERKFPESEILEACKNADLLVLDDLGAEYVKSNNGTESWVVDKIYTIVNSRSDKPLVITTNYQSQPLANKYGEHGGRIVSRMMKGTEPVKIEAPDYRIKGVKAN